MDKAMTPGAFPAGAAAGLAPVAQQVSAVHADASSGNVKLTHDAAKQLLDALHHARATLEGVMKASAVLEQPLRFGDSFVAKAMSERLQGAATDGTEAALPVLRDFGAVLHDLELTVKAARGLYTAKDEAGREHLDKIAKQFGMQSEVENAQ